VTTTTFQDLGLADPILRALRDLDYSTPTPIQAQAIPALIEGRDMLGVAQTGTGKTAAFALPILHNLSQGRGRKAPRALILAPTRELAIQIGREMQGYAAHLKLRQTVIFGGVSQKPQTGALARGVDIVIATPGRFIDLMGQGHANLAAIEHFVLDEADRMLDMGFVRDVRRIVAAMPRERQSLLFSATMPKEIARLSREVLTDPVRVEVAPQSTPVERIEQSVRHVPAAKKPSLLLDILQDPDMSRVIVFTRTKHRANRVAEHLAKSGVAADAIHGNKSQTARQRALKRFGAGEARVLVATDIAARGIDIGGVTHVVNFELPNEPESYVHRIGRTARAGASGAAILFCDPAEKSHLRSIERLIGRRLDATGEVESETAQAPAPGARPARKRRRRRGRDRAAA
jgi:ATP-dependent RNA helicase RhlE